MLYLKLTIGVQDILNLLNERKKQIYIEATGKHTYNNVTLYRSLLKFSLSEANREEAIL